jgi:hypothetical protein
MNSEPNLNESNNADDSTQPSRRQVMLELELTRRNNNTLQLARWRADPVLYAQERFGIYIWDKLAELLRSVRDNPKTFVYSANGIGKTFVSGIVPCWWLECFQPSVVLITGSSWDTIKDTILPYIRTNIRGTTLLEGEEPNELKIKIAEDHFLTTRSTRKAERIAGLHSEHLLQIVEESSGIERDIADAIDGNDTGAHGRQLWLGNPRTPSGPFYEGIKERKGHVIKISAFDHPNVKEGRTVVPGAIGREKIVQRLKDFKCQKVERGTPGAIHIFWPHADPASGTMVDEAWYLPSVEFGIRVLSDFPLHAENALISPIAINAAIRKVEGEPRALGCDAARFGEDETVITLANDQGIISLRAVNGKDTVWTQDKITEYKTEYPELTIAVDDASFGGGITDNLRAANIDVIPINHSQASSKPERFFNLKAELYWQFKEAIESGYGIPDDPVLVLQLSRLEYEFTAKNQIRIVGKEAYKKKYGDSPDRAESAMYAYRAARFSPPVVARQRTVQETDKQQRSGYRYGRTVFTD